MSRNELLAWCVLVVICFAFAVGVLSPIQAQSECFTCTPAPCYEQDECMEGCVCVGAYGNMGKCMSAPVIR
jgi:hypothetical protein